MEFVNTINDVFYRARVVWTSQNKLFVTYIFVVYVSYRIGYDVDASMQPTAWILCVRIIICKNTMLINYDGINWMEFEGIGERIRRRHSVKRMQCIWPVFENVRVCKDMWSKWLLQCCTCPWKNRLSSDVEKSSSTALIYRMGGWNLRHMWSGKLKI